MGAHSTASGYLDLAFDDPRAAVARAEMAVRVGDEIEAIGAYWASGIAERSLGNADTSVEHLNRARDMAMQAGEEVLAADIEVTLAGSLAVTGEVDEGYAMATRAAESLPSELKPHAEVQVGTFQARRGDLDGAYQLFDSAEAVMLEQGEQQWLARLRNNRGLISVYVGRPERAVEDLTSAVEIYGSLGLRFAVAESRHNLGFAHAQRGDVARALGLYEAAGETFRQLDCPLNELLLDHADALMAAGMFDEAADMASERVSLVGNSSMALDRAETFFSYARASFYAQRWRVAAEAAETSAEVFRSLPAEGWAVRAELLAARARENVGDSLDPISIEEAATRAQGLGQAVAAWHGMLLAARSALPDVARARAFIDAVESDLSEAGVTLPELLSDVALSRVVTEHSVDADEAAMGYAFAALDTLTKATEQLEYSARSAAIATQRFEAIERLGTDVASSTGQVVEWTDAVRALPMRHLRLSRPIGEDAATLFDSIRAADDALAEEQSLENASEKSALPQSGTSGSAKPDRIRTDLARAVIARGQSTLYTVLERGSDQADLGAADEGEAMQMVDRLIVALHRGEVEAALSDLDRLASRLFTDTGFDLIDDELVLSVPPLLASVPWSLATRLRSTSLATQLSSDRKSDWHEPSAVLAIAGPGLTHAEEEAEAVASLYPDARVISPEAATRESVLHAMGEAPLLHFAGHTTFATGNPGASYFELSDGPLYLWEIEDGGVSPEVVVLASCSAAAADIAGVSVDGLSASLMRLGARSVVAPVMPVPDSAETVSLMRSLHQHMRSGLSPAGALAQARPYAPIRVASLFHVYS